MRILTPKDFFSTLKNKYLVLDTSVFIDTSIHPTEFSHFFNELKKQNIITLTIEPVITEFTKGAVDKNKLETKRQIIVNTIDAYLPLTENTFVYLDRLTELYLEDGKGVSITDFLLGAFLMQYPNKLSLLTKNTTDFPTNIFNLDTHFNLIHRKAIQSYGVYSYQSK